MRLRRWTLATGFSTGSRVVSLTMWKTSSRGRPAGLGFGPAGELLGDRVHHLDPAVGVAGDDAVADGGEGGAQVLLGVEELLGAAALQVERAAEGGGDGFEAVAGEEADDEADGEGEHDEDDDASRGLALPLRRCGRRGAARRSSTMCSSWERMESMLALAGEVEIDVVGLAAGGDGGDERLGEGLRARSGAPR